MPKRKKPELDGQPLRRPPDGVHEELSARLRQAEERFRLFMENVKEYAVFMLDTTGHVVDWNLGAEHVLGYGPEILGQPFAIFFPPDDRREGVPELELKQAADTGQSSDDRWHVRKNGSYFWALGVTTAMRDDAGTLKGFTKVLRDSTERKRFEEQLREKNVALEEGDRLKDEFLAMLAHELRNPLAPIFNALSALQHEQLSGAVGQQALSTIGRQARILARLVDDLLDVGRVNTGKIQLRRTRVDLGQIIKNAAHACLPQVEARKHQLTISLPPDALLIDADATRIEQVVTNLLSNAVKYTDDGGHITLSATQEGQHVVLRVRDTGIGISPAFMPRVFDLFAQGERSVDRAQGGLGIGLTLVRKLTEMHGGTVTATSAGSGAGSEFVVSLPRAEDEATTSIAETRSQAPKRSARPLRVVVVDDNVDAAESMKTLLSLGGHEVLTAYNGADAIAVVQRGRPDIVFLDIGMPGMNGYQVAAHVSQLPELSDTVLVAITGYGQDEAKQRGVEAGFAHYLIKPLDFARVEELLDTIGKAKGQ